MPTESCPDDVQAPSSGETASADFGSTLTHTLPRVRVLHLINGEHYAGAERVQDLLALRLPDSGIEVAFACVKANRFPKFRQSKQTLLEEWPMRGRLDPRPVWELIRFLRREKIDLVHTHTPRTALVAALAGRLTNVPTVHHVHGQTAVEVGNGWLTRVSAKAEQFSLSNARAVIAVSASAARYIHASGVPKGRIRQIHNGVPLRNVVVERPSQRSSWSLGTLAMFRPRKGLEILLQAMATLHVRGLPVRLRVIGGFETSLYHEQVLRLTRELGISRIVEWRGFRTDIDSELAEIDFMILPSILPEGMPMAVLEAMAAGVPPIGTRVEGISEVIEHGHDGLLVEPNNVDSIVRAVMSVIDGPVSWELLARNALRSHADKYSDNVMSAKVARLYREVLGLTTQPS